MKKNIILIAIIFFSAFSFAQETDAVYKNITKEYNMLTDGSLEFRCQKSLKLNTHYAFNRMFGETFIVYNPDFQKLVIHDSYTIMANGKKVETPDNAFNEVLPRAAASYPAYNQMREMVVTHTALEVGATIYLDYSIISKPSFIKELMGTVILQERVPVEQYTISLKVPARRGLKYHFYNTDTQPKESNDGTYRYYKWSFNNLEAQSYEQHSPNPILTAPALQFTTATDIEAVYNEFITQKAFQDEEIPELQQLIDETRKTSFSELEMASTLQNYILNNIATKHIPLYWHNYQLQTPKQVWDANVGSSFEKNVLLFKALQMAGLQVNLVFPYSLTLYKEQQFSLYDMSEFIVYIMFKDGNRQLLSASNPYSKNMKQGYTGYVLVDFLKPILKRGRFNSVGIYGHPAIQLSAKLTIDPTNQIVGNIDLKLSGAILDYIQMAQDTQRVKSYFSASLPFDKEQEATAVFSFPQPSEFHIPIKGDANLKEQENYFFWSIPHITKGIATEHFNLLPTQRDFPMVVPAINEEYEYQIMLPKSVNWVGKEIHISYQESFGNMTIDVAMKDGYLLVKKHLQIFPGSYKIRAEKSAMNVERAEVKIDQRNLNTKEYGQFRKMMIDWNAENTNELVFKR